MTSTRSRTPTLPKSCRTAAYSICCSRLAVNFSAANGPSEMPVDLLGQIERQGGDPARVARGRRIARFDGRHRGVDEPVEQLADLVVEERVLQRHAGLRRPGRRQLLGALVEGDHVPIEVGQRQGLARLAFLVDQLDDADHLAHRREHRHRQHRAGAVAGLVVEAAVVAEGRRLPGRRRAPQVGDVDRLSGQRRLPDDRLVVDREREGLKVDLDRVVLRQHEAQPFGDGRALLVFVLDDVDAAGVRSCHLAAALQDHGQELPDVALRGERPRGRDHLRQHVAGLVGRGLRLRVAHAARLPQFRAATCRVRSAGRRRP